MMLFTDRSRGVAIAKDPAVVYFRDRYYLYYSLAPGHSGRGWGIGIAVSQNLTNWEKIAELEPAAEYEKNGYCAPGALVIGDEVHLFYQTYGNFPKDAICHAVSKDGLSFRRNKYNPVFRPAGAWNNGRAIDADVLLYQDRLYLYFATRDPAGKIQKLGVASCLPGDLDKENAWRQCTDYSILEPELDWEKDCIEAPAVIEKDGRIFMFYAGAYNNAPQQIGLAVSDDAVHFDRVQTKPFLANGRPGSWNSSESGHPFVFKDPAGRVHLFFQGNADGGQSWFISRLELDFSASLPRLASGSKQGWSRKKE